MNEKLLPCPFCGGEALLRERYINGTANIKHYRRECHHCKATFANWYRSIKKADEAWNRRAQPENEPIVHCAECEHYTPSQMGGNGCLIRFNGRTEIIPRNPTDYCSYGKRKPERSEGE